MNNNTFKTRDEFLTLIPKKKICCEIGVFRGDYSKKIFDICKPKKLFLVDIFDGPGCSGDKDGLNMVYTNDLNDFYRSLKDHFKNNEEVELVKNSSSTFFDSKEDNFFDFVYIDGDHQYNGVYQDLVNGYKKLKVGGILSGHDYHESIAGVKEAVNKFTTDNNIEFFTTTQDLLPTFWMVKK